MSAGCLQDVCRTSDGCLEDVWRDVCPKDEIHGEKKELGMTGNPFGKSGKPYRVHLHRDCSLTLTYKVRQCKMIGTVGNVPTSMIRVMEIHICQYTNVGTSGQRKNMPASTVGTARISNLITLDRDSGNFVKT